MVFSGIDHNGSPSHALNIKHGKLRFWWQCIAFSSVEFDAWQPQVLTIMYLVFENWSIWMMEILGMLILDGVLRTYHCCWSSKEFTIMYSYKELNQYWDFLLFLNNSIFLSFGEHICTFIILTIHYRNLLISLSWSFDLKKKVVLIDL